MRASNVVLIILSTLLVLTTLNALSVQAQTKATVIIMQTDGGITYPAAGTTIYPDGHEITFTAMPDTSFVFLNWVISTADGNATQIDNPLTMPLTGGVEYTIQAVFEPVQPLPGRPLPPSLDNAAIIVMLPSAGGSTSPAPGTYALADATNFNLKATPYNGWQFSHWTICGDTIPHGNALFDLTPAENPYNVNHGYGLTYYYQAAFVPVGESTPTPTASINGLIGRMSMETWIIIGLVVAILAILVGFSVYIAKLNKHP